MKTPTHPRPPLTRVPSGSSHQDVALHSLRSLVHLLTLVGRD